MSITTNDLYKQIRQVAASRPGGAAPVKAVHWLSDTVYELFEVTAVEWDNDMILVIKKIEEGVQE